MTIDERRRILRTGANASRAAQAKNFYYSFLLLPLPQRRAMCAIYAFMRYCDDLSDDEGIRDRAAAIARWRADLESRAARATRRIIPLWPAFVDAVQRYRIPHSISST